MAYLIPASTSEREIVIKKSRFIARVVHVQDRSEVNLAVAQSRLEYPDARHHCWAYLLGSPADARNAGMSDDGEPSGTAGKPILNVLQHGELGDALVIVVRYFGGIKLGAGGLVRAYGAATQQVLEGALTFALRDMVQLTLNASFAAEQPLRHRMSLLEAEVQEVSYGDVVTILVAVPLENEDTLRQFCGAQGITVVPLED